nr:receptor-like protein 12 [Ipomoea trifida]
MGNFGCNYTALIIFLVLPSACFFALETTSSARKEAEALLKWKSSLQSVSEWSSSYLDSWSLSNLRNMCNWTGIVCNAGGATTVSQINLPYAGLSGTLHHLNFTSFPSLTRFDIGGNNFNGSIPPAIGDLSHLVFLDLSHNWFDGSIPPQIGKLRELQYLSLSDNKFSGVVPHQIGNLQKVGFLDLGFNSYLEAPHWSTVKSFPVLRHLSFSGNKGFGSSFLDFIPGHRNLTHLDLSENYLNGSIPESLFTTLEKLEYLDLSENNFSGPLSPKIGKLSNLKELYLYYNSFQGEIPSSIGQLKNLQFLDISHNEFNSSIPSELGHCTNLTYLDLRLNSLFGALPSSLSSLTKKSSLSVFEGFSFPLDSWSLSNLRNMCNWRGIVCNGGRATTVSQINLPNAHLSGTLHHLNFTSFPSLTGFNISGNYFEGSIPPAIGDLSNLVFLDLSYNTFHGNIPPQIGNLTELQHFDLYGGNYMSGVIPHQFGNLQKVCFLDFGNNPFLDASDWLSKVKSYPMLRHFSFSRGELISFPDFILCSRNLTYLGLRGTNLNGSIPESLFTNLEKLEYLDLSDNEFFGPLSPNINNLSNLKDLILSGNQFQGEIPYSIGQLKNLQVLDISYNLLNSAIPSSLSSLTKLSNLDLSSNFISGDISRYFISIWTKLTNLGLAYNSFHGSLPSEIANEPPTPEPCLPIIPTSHCKEFQSGIDDQMDNIPVQSDLSEGSDAHLSGNDVQHHSPIPISVESAHDEPSNVHTADMDHEIQMPLPVPLRRSNRQRQLPNRLNDYYCDVVIQNRTSPHVISKVISYDALIFLVVSCFFAWETIASTTTEAEALLKWKSGLSMYYGSSFPLKSWSLSNLTNLCNWRGIVCNAGGAVSQINLPYADLYGTLHHLNFTSFPSLTGFNITGNYFNGSIPPAIADLSNLVFLDLSNNEFDGNIPPQIGSLTKLQHLDLSRNFFIRGVIPHQIGNLRELQYLDLNSNNMSGVIPHQIGNLQKVWFLDFGYNNNLLLDASDWSSKVKSFPMLRHFSFFAGTMISFPDFILCSRNLTYLDLRESNLNGSIPESLFPNLKKLEYLDLSDNKFSGFLSPHFNNLSNLKHLILSRNQFQGEIPYSIGQLKDLQVLDISQNLLNSTIPSLLSSLTKLSTLDLSSNFIFGNISPHLISNWTKLTHLWLADNSFNGSIPPEIDRFSPDDKYSRQRVLLKKCMFWFVAVIQKSPLRY